VKSDLDDVGATVLVALLPVVAVRGSGDHKGRPSGRLDYSAAT